MKYDPRVCIGAIERNGNRAQRDDKFHGPARSASIINSRDRARDRRYAIDSVHATSAAQRLLLSETKWPAFRNAYRDGQSQRDASPIAIVAQELLFHGCSRLQVRPPLPSAVLRRFGVHCDRMI